MIKKSKYLFKSKRLGFRTWTLKDFDLLHLINSDENTMKFFPKTYSVVETREFIERMIRMYEDLGFCYYAVELLEDSTFIGVIGLGRVNFEADFNPSIDIGWRLSSDFWGKGYASEGAQTVLMHGFEALNLKTILSIAPVVNLPSVGVMQKIGMKKVKEFKHPLLEKYEDLKQCVLYEISK